MLRLFESIASRRRSLLAGALVLALVAASGCRAPSDAVDDRPLVVASTTMIEDLARALAPDAVRVEGIMEPGGDPHLYQPTPSDARLVAGSDLVLRNGLHLEGWIDDLLANAGGSRAIITVSDGVDPIHMEGFAGGVDPHIWFDVALWRTAASNTADALAELVAGDPDAVAQVRERHAAYDARLEALDEWVRTTVATIPQERRVLITSHDAFNYFGRAYGLDVRGIQGISTEQEASQRDVADVVDLVRARSLPAVFVETSVNPGLVRQVARETGVEVLGPLYSDSLGAPDGPAATWLGMLTENVRLVTEGLGGTYTPWTTSAEG